VKSLLDSDYLAFAIFMGILGIVGITATANVNPNILSTTCECIPSPLARLQELSFLFLAFGVVLAPIGLLKRGTSPTSSGLSQAQSVTTPSGAYTGFSMRNGEFFFLGVGLVVFGITMVAVPSFLVLGNRILVGEGVATILFGLFLAYRGGRSR
jgi:hypothetical protein